MNMYLEKDLHARQEEKIEHIILKGDLECKLGWWTSAKFDPMCMDSCLRQFSSLKTFKIVEIPLDEKMIELVNQLPLLQKVYLQLRKKDEISSIKKIKNAEKIKVEFWMDKENHLYKMEELPQSSKNWLAEKINKKTLTTSDKSSKKSLIGAFIRGEITIEMPFTKTYGWLSYDDPLIIKLSSTDEGTFKEIFLRYASQVGGIDFLASFFEGIPFECTRWDKKVSGFLLKYPFIKHGFTLKKRNEK